MRSSFARFTAIFIFCVLAAFAGYLYVTGRLGSFKHEAASAPATRSPANSAPANSAKTPLPAAPPTPPLPTTAPSTAQQPATLDAPPDLSGLNFQEVAIPGSDLLQPTAPYQQNIQTGDYVGELSSRKLRMPLDGVAARDLRDSFNDQRGTSRHEATDLMAPRGTPVHAIDEGNVVKLFTSKRGGLTVYQFDNARKYCYYYAHLDRYAPGVREGMLVRPGDVIGFVGSTGDADVNNPHLHFAISLLDPDKKYWKGTPLNPYPVLVKLAPNSM